MATVVGAGVSVSGAAPEKLTPSKVGSNSNNLQ